MQLKLFLLAGCMLVFGSINTIAVKFQDLAIVGLRPDGTPLTYFHPALQCACMFLGEMLCLIPYLLSEWRHRRNAAAAGMASANNSVHGGGSYSKLLLTASDRRRVALAKKSRSWHVRRLCIFALPACCDAIASTLLNVGLYYTFTSVYQMLRGTLVLFAGFFTVTILRRRLYIHHYMGTISKCSTHTGWLPPTQTQGSENVDAASAPLFGDMMVVAAQAFAALQFILEEKFVSEYKVPTLLAVGLEGSWGMGLALLALPLSSYLTGPDGGPLDDAVEYGKACC
ncbi:MAG: hypothetical protein WDW38_005560 [Sanguina aurantia]